MAFASHKIITIPAANIPSSQTDFPFLFAGTYSFLMGQAFGGTVRSSVGNDIVFSSNSAGTAILDFERVVYRASDGHCQYRIRIQATGATNYVVFVCYDDATVSGYLGNNAGTWASAYRTSYHLGDGTTLSNLDSTGNANTLAVQHGAVAASGIIDGGVSCPTAADCMSFANVTSVRVQTPFAIRAWVYLTTYRFGVIYTLFDGLGNYNYQLGSNSGTPFFLWRNGASTPFLSDPSTIPLNTWTQLTVRVTGTTAVKFWVNNINTSNPTSGISVPAMFSGGTGFLGGDNGTSALGGTTSEVMLYNGTLSDDLESMLYHNEFSPATFYNVTSNNHWSETAAGVFVLTGLALPNIQYHSAVASGQFLLDGIANPSQGFHNNAASGQFLLGGHAQGTEGYHSPKASGQLLLDGKAIITVGEVPLTCVTGDGTGGPVAPTTTADLSFSY